MLSSKAACSRGVLYMAGFLKVNGRKRIESALEPFVTPFFHPINLTAS